MKNHIKTVVATFAVVTLTFGSCKKALIEKPYDFISTAQLGSSEKDAEYFVNGALNTINSGAMWGYGAFPKVLELDSDDATGPDWGMGDYGAGNFSSFWGMNAMWAGPYMLIQRSNFGLSRVEAMNINQEMKNNVLGQLNFLKAWGYFLLVRAYGPVPLLKKSIVDGENPQQGRASVKDVYDYIVETLKLAEGQLYSVKSPGYIKGRISKGAASTLLAKVYLTMASGATAGAQITVLTGPAAKIVNGKTVRINKPVPMTFTKEKIAGYDFDATQYFTLARDKAKEVMDSGDYNLFPHFMDVWTVANRNSVEHIWSMQALSNDATLGNGTSVDYVGIFKSPISDISKDVPQVTNGKWYGIRDHWYELFDDNDERINEGVLHRWQDGNGYYQYYPGKDSSVVKGTDTSPRANALRAKYGYQTTDNYGADAGHICALRKFMGVTNPTIDRQDFHFPFLRYADVLLMYAEAENELNGPAGAKAALKQVRTRSEANNDVVDAITDKQAFRSFVLEERRRELALEANRRWDLLRWGIYEQVMNAVDIDENSVLKRRQDKHLLYPIPGEEISSNPLIPINNPGW